MSFPHIRSNTVFLGFLVAGVAVGLSPRMFGGDIAKRLPPKQASFQIKNEFKVQPAKGAKKVRMWFAVPQEDSASVIREFRVTADFPVQYFQDDWETASAMRSSTRRPKARSRSGKSLG